MRIESWSEGERRLYHPEHGASNGITTRVGTPRIAVRRSQRSGGGQLAAQHDPQNPDTCMGRVVGMYMCTVELQGGYGGGV